MPFAAVFALSLALVVFLPLYVERTMTHVMFADSSGGAIEWVGNAARCAVIARTIVTCAASRNRRYGSG